jgi:APA family basic amino acid/polyamine antiporter
MTKATSSLLARMLARKPLAAVHAEAAEAALKPTLGRLQLLMIGIGCIIGAGIFVRTGNAAAVHAGPAVVLSFLIASAVCALTGFCYAELTSTLPASGSAFTYAHVALGHFAAWIVGSLLILEYGLAAAVVAVGWSGYVVSLLGGYGLVFPPQWAAPSGHLVAVAGGAMVPAVINAPAMAVAATLSALLVLGVRESATVNTAIVLLKVGVIVLFIAIGGVAILANPSAYLANWHPFLPANTGTYGAFGWSGVLRAASVVVFAYLGFEAVATAGLEAKNPGRDMPFGVLGGLIVSTMLYALVAVVLTLLAPYASLNVPDPLAVAVDRLGAHWAWFALLIKTGAVFGLTSVVLVLIYAQTRIFYAMARDGFLPRVFARVHPRLGTPWINTILVGLMTTLAAGTFDFNVMGDLTSVGTLTAFAVVAFAVIRLRRVAPDLPRGYRVPFYPLVPLGSIAASLALMLSVGPTVLTFFAGYLAVVVLIYIVRARFAVSI